MAPGAQCTSHAFIGCLAAAESQSSLAGRGKALDKILEKLPFCILTMGYASPRNLLSGGTVALHIALGMAAVYNKGLQVRGIGSMGRKECIEKDFFCETFLYSKALCYENDAYRRCTT